MHHHLYRGLVGFGVLGDVPYQEFPNFVGILVFQFQNYDVVKRGRGVQIYGLVARVIDYPKMLNLLVGEQQPAKTDVLGRKLDFHHFRNLFGEKIYQSRHNGKANSCKIIALDGKITDYKHAYGKHYHVPSVIFFIMPELVSLPGDCVLVLSHIC